MLFTIIKGFLQYHNTFKPSALDFFPRGKYSILVVVADIVAINLVLLLSDKITFSGFISVFLSVAALFSFVFLISYINGKELEDARDDLAKARNVNRERGMFDAEKEAHIARVEMELTGLRARVKRHKDSVELLVSENNHLKKLCENLKKEKLSLAEESDRQRFDNENISTDAVSKVLLQENEQLKNINEQLRKLVDIQKIRNEDLLRKQNHIVAEKDWTAYIPYAQGDSLEDVKKAYRCLAKAMHPDSGDGNEEKMRKVNEAWEKAQKWFSNYQP